MQFNETKESKTRRTTNHEGGEAFDPADPQFALYKVTINNLLEDTYYQQDEDSLTQVRQRFQAAADDNPEFPLQLAAYARQEMYLRDISQLLLVLSAHHDESKQYVRRYAPKIIDRADEPMTVIAIHNHLYGDRTAIPKPLKKGISDALHSFDGYQFAKYDTDRRQVNLKDVLNRVHPTPQDDQHDELFERIIYGELDEYPDVEPLDTPETWETVISENGNTAEAWRSVLDRMGMFAKLRNLRNMKQAGLDSEEILDEDDLDHVQESKLYPFRFYQAYAALQDAGETDPYIEDWLSDAINETAANLPDELEDTLAVADISGSMRHPVSNNSQLEQMEIATLFTAVLMRNGARGGAFADDFTFVEAHHRTPTLELQEKIGSQSVGGSTNGWKVFKTLVEQEIAVDRVVLLTDMQIWDSTGYGFRRDNDTVKEWFDRYRDEVNEDVALYMIDLASYGDLVTPDGYENVYNINGWTSKVIEFIEYAEKPRQVLAEIRQVAPAS